MYMTGAVNRDRQRQCDNKKDEVGARHVTSTRHQDPAVTDPNVYVFVKMFQS